MRKMNIFLIAIIIILAVFQVIILNSDSTSGSNLSSILNEIEELERQNVKLSREIASASAIATLNIKAKEAGLTYNQQIVSLSNPLPLALSDKRSL